MHKAFVEGFAKTALDPRALGQLVGRLKTPALAGLAGLAGAFGGHALASEMGEGDPAQEEYQEASEDSIGGGYDGYMPYFDDPLTDAYGDYGYADDMGYGYY